MYYASYVSLSLLHRRDRLNQRLTDRSSRQSRDKEKRSFGGINQDGQFERKAFRRDEKAAVGFINEHFLLD